MKKIFITGANGFIGSNLCTYFLNKGFDVYGLVRETSDLHFLEGSAVKLIFGDLKKPEKIPIPRNLDYLIHSASVVSDAASEEECCTHIFLISKNLFRKIKSMDIRLKKFIYISTALTLGYDAMNISEENQGESAVYLPYVYYKKKTEDFFLKQHKKNNFPVTILRPADVYGPNDRTSCLLMLNGIKKKLPFIVGHGNWYFGYCYSENLCLAAYLICQKNGSAGKAYTVTNSKLPTWREFFSGFQEELDRKQRLYVPVWISRTAAVVYESLQKLFPRYRPPLTRYRIKRITSHTTYDISKTLVELNYRPDNDIKKQVKEIVSWYQKEKKWELGKKRGQVKTNS